MTEAPKVWRYDIPSDPEGQGWGVFLLSSDGFFAAVSDYGNYAYQWRSFGPKDFREFVIGLEGPYLAGKLASRSARLPDEEATAVRVKGSILAARRKDLMSKGDARNEWDLANKLHCYDLSVDVWLMDTEIEDAGDLVCTRMGHSIRNFVEKLMPRLGDRIRNHLTVGASLETTT